MNNILNPWASERKHQNWVNLWPSSQEAVCVYKVKESASRQVWGRISDHFWSESFHKGSKILDSKGKGAGQRKRLLVKITKHKVETK